MWRRSWENEARLQRLFEDLPPGALVSREINKEVILDYDELERAKWFWDRRPSGLPRIGNAFIVLLLCLAFYLTTIQQIIADLLNGAILSALCATLLMTFVHICQYAQWKSEYRCAVLRLLPKDW
jgi:hypothetical protein